MLAGWRWDVALLQEVPPWWAEPLARACDAEQRRALTSRNALPALRRLVAERHPDAIKSNGGGANAVLTRGAIAEHAALRLRTWPERRVAQLVRLGCGTTVVNHHGSARVPLAEDELRRLWVAALAFARGGPLVLGGDLNLREPRPAGGAEHVAWRDVDHLFALGLHACGEAQRLAREVRVEAGRVQLSDHLPLAVTLRPGTPTP